jgi:hypothetical protein
MFCVGVEVVCRCVPSTDVLLWGSSWSCIDVLYVVCVLSGKRQRRCYKPEGGGFDSR